LAAVRIARQLANLCTVTVMVAACVLFAPGGERFEHLETSDLVSTLDGSDALPAMSLSLIVAPTDRRRAIFVTTYWPPSQPATVEVFRPPQTRL
jgi:hypothetical protein